ncbi:MAG: Fe-S cluster assembly ATPase SufC [Acidimicrobiia bacterium]
MSRTALEIAALRASVGELEIITGVDLELSFGEIHALMGPNGSGKSTLCHALMGKPGYQVSGSAKVDGVEILGRPVDERARLGLFEGFQYPVEVPGVTLADLMREVEQADQTPDGFSERVQRAAAELSMEPFLDRSLNERLSGGEKKRSEIFQLAVLRPKVAVLDEVDSGLDIDAVQEVGEAVERMRSPDRGVLIITHYSRILRYLSPDRVHVMMEGRIVRSGGSELADELEQKGYDVMRQELGLEPAVEEATADPFAGL